MVLSAKASPSSPDSWILDSASFSLSPFLLFPFPCYHPPMSLIDILIPVRNADAFLGEAVGSVISQTFSDWRIIAVDDHSTDDTWAILCALAETDHRTICIRNEGSGIVQALNTALSYSTAPFLARMDADDLSSSGRLEKVLALMDSEPSAGVAGSRVAVFPPEAASANMKRYIKWQNSLITPDQIRRERYVESTMTHATAVFRREVLLETGGWYDGPFPEDLDLWLRLHREGVRFIKHPEALYFWREHGLRETRHSRRCTPEAFHRCKVRHLTAELLDRSINRVCILGPEGARRRWTVSLAEKGFKTQSFAWKPGNPVPEQVGNADLVLAVFGMPGVRARARDDLSQLGEEEDRWLFVG